MEDIQTLKDKIAAYEQQIKELRLQNGVLRSSFEVTSMTSPAQDQIRNRLGLMLNNVGIWERNIKTGELYWSDECKNIYGVPLDKEIDYQLFTGLIHPDDRVKVQQAIDKAMASETGNYEVTNRIIRYDNQQQRWIKIKGQVFFDDQHQGSHFIGTVIDFTESKLAEEKISASEKLFKSIALNIPDSLIIMIDKNHRFTTIEGDIMQRMGYDSSIYTGKHLEEVGPPERYATTKDLYDRMLSGEKFSTERKSDSGGQYMVHFIPLKDDHDEVEAGLIIAMDITKAKEAEEKSAKLVAIIESSDDAIVSKTLEGIVTSWNNSAQRIFGYTAEEMIGQSILKVIPPDRHHEEEHILSRMRNGERIKHFVTKRRRKDGQMIDVSLTISPVKDQQGKIIGLSKIARDVTEFKLAQEKSAKLAAIIESTDDAIVSKTLEGIITSWNASAKRIFGYVEEEMIGQSILKLIPEDRQHEEVHILSRLSKGERVQHFETKRLKKDGTLFDVSLTVSPVRDQHGNIIGVSKIARDITERKQEEQRKNDFVAMVSHELKTPLTSIMGYIQLLIAKAKKDGYEQSINMLRRTELQAKKMTNMIHDFLNLAKMEEGKMQLSPTLFELKPLIEEVANDEQFSSEKHTVHLDTLDGLLINADRDKISHVLINLLSNAIKYSPNGGNITIGTKLVGDKVRIYVKDEGLGISLNDQKRLFERFYRINDGRIKNVSGFGIGLYLVSEIVHYHHSKIMVESKEQQGSTFYFDLQLAN